MTYSFNITPAKLWEHFTKDELFDLILGIDLEIAEVDFTEKLVIELIKSMKCDLSEKEWEPYDTLLKQIDPS